MKEVKGGEGVSYVIGSEASTYVASSSSLPFAMELPITNYMSSMDVRQDLTEKIIS